MIKLQYPRTNKLTESWTERLEELIVDYTVEIKTDLETVVLFENEKRFEGEEAISKFITDLEEFMGDWRTVRCGV